MIVTILLQILLIIISICIIRDKDNLRIVVFFAVFSLITASLYYMYHAPDLALAEVAIGSAIIPLVFIIAISKQKEFLVVSHIKEDVFLNPQHGQGYTLLKQFADLYGLKLVITEEDYDQLQGVFREKNVDLVVDFCPNTNIYVLKGKKTSILMNRLQQITQNYNNIKVVMIEEGETID